MVYFIFGISLLTFCFSWYILYKMTIFVDNYVSKPGAGLVPFRQSTIHGFAERYMPTNQQINKVLNDLDQLYQSPYGNEQRVKVIVTGDKAYWIHNNVFYSSLLTPNGEIDKDTSKPITTEGLSKEEIDILMEILDDLRRQENDDSSSGN